MKIRRSDILVRALGQGCPIYEENFMHVVMSAFAEMDHAETAVTNLQAAGFSSDKIGVLMRNDLVQPEAADEALIGAGMGALAGTAVGGLFGLLIGATAITVPIFGPILASGLVATTLGGAATGAVYGTLLGLVIKLGLMGEDAQFYTETLANDGVIVLVEAHGERAAEAWRIMHEAKATRTQSTILGQSQNTSIAMPVIGLFPDSEEASQAMKQLLVEGIEQEEIYLIDTMNMKETNRQDGRYPHLHVPKPQDLPPMPVNPAQANRQTAEARLTRLGIDEADAPFYLDAVQQGGALLIVTTDDKEEAATSRTVMKAMDVTQMAAPA
jgi:hypothetical protein